jgi:hypothetical protein
MKWATVAALILAIAGLVLAGDEPLVPKERLRQLQRDLRLVQVLVQEGLLLAGEEDPLKRARTCNVVADSLVKEIQRAAGARDARRTANLGIFLQDVLVQGVAGNVDLARGKLSTRAREDEFKQIGEQVVQITRPVSEEIRQAPESEQKILQPAAQAASTGRLAVEMALKRKS